MPAPNDPQDDLSVLDDFLMSHESPENCMMLTDLDGFLTGVVIGPVSIPPSEWLPVIWGGDEEPVFNTAAQAQSILGAIMNRYNEILDKIADNVLEPIFLEAPTGEVSASDWAEGFMQAVRLRAEAWDKLFMSQAHTHLVIPILAICCDEAGKSLLAISQDTEDRFFEDAGELIPVCVLEIAAFWHAARPGLQ